MRWENDNKRKSEVAYKELKKRIAKNLNWLLEKKCMGKSTLCQKLENNGQVSMDRATVSKFLNHPEQYNIGIPFLVACADYLEVSVDALVSKDIRLYSYRSRDGESFEKLLDLPEIMKKEQENSNSGSGRGDTFIIDPNSHYFQKYYQTYYCYYYSTVADENKREDSIITGEMRMYHGAHECGVEFKINTKSYDEEGNPNYKWYIGSATVSPKTQVFHCSLCDEHTGEYCDIIFRYSQVNFNKQDCRMALILSTSSTPDKRYPIVHRMFMSREEIKPEDLPLIASHLCLNYSKILISEKALLSLQEQSYKHQEMVDELLKRTSEPMYMISEREIREIAEKYLGEEEEPFFLSKLRGVAMAYHYNKVSTGVDTMVRDILYNAGYYQQKRPSVEK